MLWYAKQARQDTDERRASEHAQGERALGRRDDASLGVEHHQRHKQYGANVKQPDRDAKNE